MRLPTITVLGALLALIQTGAMIAGALLAITQVAAVEYLQRRYVTLIRRVGSSRSAAGREA